MALMTRVSMLVLITMAASNALTGVVAADNTLIGFEVVYDFTLADGRNPSCSYEKDIRNRTSDTMRVTVDLPLQMITADGSPLGELVIEAGDSRRARLHDVQALKTATLNETTPLVFTVDGVQIVDPLSVASRCGDLIKSATFQLTITTTTTPAPAAAPTTTVPVTTTTSTVPTTTTPTTTTMVPTTTTPTTTTMVPTTTTPTTTTTTTPSVALGLQVVYRPAEGLPFTGGSHRTVSLIGMALFTLGLVATSYAKRGRRDGER